ncbi:MAG: sulfatase [Planctomycetaceae bacterium]|jgi:arylsulfatase A|nr:sulfatase [Planctomycetaceae bacterium]
MICLPICFFAERVTCGHIYGAKTLLTLPRLVKLFACVWWLLLSTQSSVLLAVEREHPNIVFFLVDDLGWRDTGVYGSTFYRTPNIDRFAKQGVRFTSAYAACHVCSPTRASIMTGKYPARLQLTDWLPGRREFSFQKLQNAPIHQYLPESEVTIAEALKAHGYNTAHIGKWHLGEEPHGPRSQGFDVQIPSWNKGWPKSGYHAPFGFNGLAGKENEYLTDRLTDEAEKFMEVNQDHPFFLYLSHFAVHDPIQGRNDLVADYRKRLANSKPSNAPAFVLEGAPNSISEEVNSLPAGREHEGYRVFSDRTVKIKQRQDNVQFAAMVEAMDQSLGRILAKLKKLGLEKDTIVIFFSDNGGMSAANFGNPLRIVSPEKLDRAYATSNLPLRGAKGWLYEGGIREPLIVRWPQQGRSGVVCDEPVMSTDFYPTILEMAGLPARSEQHVDGVSLTPLLTGGGKLSRKAIYWHFPHYSNHGMQSPGGAIRVGDYKLLEYFENSAVQLFNLRNDIGEQKNLAAREPAKVEELQALLNAWRVEVKARMPIVNPDYLERPVGTER